MPSLSKRMKIMITKIEWSEVGEGLPELDELHHDSRMQSRRVLVACGDTVVIGCLRQTDFNSPDNFWVDSSGYVLWQITHWAELPKSPNLKQDHGALGSCDLTSSMPNSAIL